MPDASPPTPEHFLSLIRQKQRGRLKIYLGFAAGVGKTYEMLQEGQRLMRLGLDVVIGIVETHGRAETAAQIGDLEHVPRKRIEYHGVVLEELDVDAVLLRHPQVALIDELAHTNAPGSRNYKRYQDIEEMLRAGINVIASLNIQHLESLYDMVEKATGVRVKERIPDYVLGMADQLVNVDISAEDLRERLQAGKIYPKDRIETALQNFFTQTNLTQLREFTMEELAHRLDRQRSDASGLNAKGNSDGVLICLSSLSPNAPWLLRKGARLADRLKAPWYALYIQTPKEEMHRIDAATQNRIHNNLALTQQMGGIPLQGKGTDVVATIVVFAKEYNITHIVMGRSRRSWYRRLFRQSFLERLLQTLPEVDVHIVSSPQGTEADANS